MRLRRRSYWMRWGDSVCCLCAVVVAMFHSRTVQAQNSLDEIVTSQKLQTISPVQGRNSDAVAVATNGYLSNRFTYSLIDPSGPIATIDAPSIAELVEANVQLRIDLASRLYFIYGDLSLIYQGGWLFYADDGSGGRTRIANHDVPALRPMVVPSELYLSASPRPWLSMLAGKKRIQWGSGVAFNPMDLINPPKDPTDPNAQRAGNWVARVEFPFEKATVSALFAPQALYTQQGLPYAMFRYPNYAPSDKADTRDSQSHFLLAARVYALLLNADTNLVYFFSNRYQDGFEKKSRLGISFSRYFFTDYELHFEALLSQGSSRSFPNHACAQGASLCDSSAASATSNLDSKSFSPRVIVGTRRQFMDESLLSLEYYYQGDGYTDQQFFDALSLLAQAKAENASAALTNRGSASGALPQRFLFEPLRRHYLIASYNKPRIYDDWTAGAVLIAGLEDLSGILAPSLSWSAAEWLTLTLYGQIPIRGIGVGEAKINGASWSEYSLVPFDFRASFEARAFY